MSELGENRYGKSAVRLVKVERGSDRHLLRDLTVAIALEGEFERAHTHGDNSMVLPTDTMKNTVYALARDGLIGAIEDYAALLGRHFLNVEAVRRARVEIRENLWQRLAFDGVEHPHAFARSANEQRVALATVTREGAAMESGVEELLVLKTTDSAFVGYIVDAFTTLPPAPDRIFATVIQARWTYQREQDYDRVYQAVREALLRTFAHHKSESVQHTLYAMGDAALSAAPELAQIRLTLPNRHHLPVDLSRFGLPNRNDIFVATSEPYGLIEATVRRG